MPKIEFEGFEDNDAIRDLIVKRMRWKDCVYCDGTGINETGDCVRCHGSGEEPRRKKGQGR